VLVALFFVMLVVVALTSDPATTLEKVVRDVSLTMLLVGTPVAIGLVWRWSVQQQLGFDDAAQFLFSSTAPSSFWRRPHIARLLAPAMHGVRPPDPLVPTDSARAVDELLRRFPTAFASVAPAVQRAVQYQLAAIAVIDRELASLARDASPAEISRLSARLAVLTDAAPTSQEQNELAETLRRQLDLMRRIQGQQTLAQTRRSTALATLSAVWPHLNALLEADADGESAAQAAAQRILTLCTRILGGSD
jgi:hypothetical protein